MAASNRRHKDAIYAQIARIGKATANPKRLELLDLLCQAPRTVEALAQQASLSVASTSQHLQVLRAARLVEAEKQGLYVEYRVDDDEVRLFYHALRTLAGSRLAEMEEAARRYLGGRAGMEPVDGDELIRRVREGAVTVLDVRPPEEYQAGHVPGAISMPLPELRRRLAELPKDREVVAYCRGPYCVMAIEAVEILRRKGLRAIRMEDGVIEWRARGLPIEASQEGRA